MVRTVKDYAGSKILRISVVAFSVQKGPFLGRLSPTSRDSQRCPLKQRFVSFADAVVMRLPKQV